jgi:hypothetical protein
VSLFLFYTTARRLVQGRGESIARIRKMEVRHPLQVPDSFTHGSNQTGRCRQAQPSAGISKRTYPPSQGLELWSAKFAKRSLFKQSILRHIHSPFQSEISSTLSLPKEHPVAAYVFILVSLSLLPSIFPSVTCIRRPFLRKMWPIQLAFITIARMLNDT